MEGIALTSERNPMMRILGIHDGHTATACYFEGGTIKTTLSEERLTRVKGQGGFPSKSIEYLIDKGGISPKSLDKIALVGVIKPLVSIDQYKDGRQQYFPHIAKLFPGNPRFLIRTFVTLASKARLREPSLISHLRRAGLEVDKVEVVEHHQAHAATAYYLSPFHTQGVKTLVITLDGSGDGLSGTVSIVDERGAWQRVREISTFDSLGTVYSRVTQYLGMKPWEHEYKLMGMAPYVSGDHGLKAKKVMEHYIRLGPDGLGFRNSTRLWGNSLLKRMEKDLRGFRFDAVSAGVQMIHEELVVTLIRNWLRKTGIRQLAVAGGCFMNVKANKLLAELQECEQLFVMPSCGDESCAIGAAVWSYVGLAHQGHGAIQPLKDLYWGPQYSDGEVEDALKEFSDLIDFRKSQDVERDSARLLAEHKIIGRMSGRMEWGARALGNRSILANPSQLQNLRKLNAAIKMRDFWMPFAPSILWERREDYAILHRDTGSYYMTMAYDSTPKAREHLIAALHPYDFTMRPQFVKEDHNPKYYKLLTEFKALTGIGGVLNTSFNLHGWPIICSPQDAVRTLVNSGLDYVTINNYIIWKKSDLPVGLRSAP